MSGRYQRGDSAIDQRGTRERCEGIGRVLAVDSIEVDRRNYGPHPDSRNEDSIDRLQLGLS